MARSARPTVTARLLEALVAESSACLRQAGDGSYRLVKSAGS